MPVPRAQLPVSPLACTPPGVRSSDARDPARMVGSMSREPDGTVDIVSLAHSE